MFNRHSALRSAIAIALVGLVVASATSTALPLGDKPIHPGVPLQYPHACVLGFILRNVDTGELAALTSGSCVDYVGQAVHMRLTLPEAGWPVLSTLEVGTVTVRHSGGRGDNFALIQIHPELHDAVDPTMPGGGPCGVHQDLLVASYFPPFGSVPVVIAGAAEAERHGLGVDPNMATPNVPYFTVAAPASMDDAGSPVRAWVGNGHEPTTGIPATGAGSGGAVGILTMTISPFATGTRMVTILDALGPSWELVSSPTCPAAL